MAKKQIVGICRICGQHGPLTFEHIPPRKAFNDSRFLAFGPDELEKIAFAPSLGTKAGTISQKGSGKYSLCARCNNVTGGWYGEWYLDWVYQAHRILFYSRGDPSLIYQYRIFPLRVIKQIVAMFLSLSGEGGFKNSDYLRRFVLNRLHTGLPPDYRVYCYYNISAVRRMWGGFAKLNTDNGEIRVGSELVAYPFGYYLRHDGPVDDRIVDISFFANYQYNDWKEFSLQLPVANIKTALPGDLK